MVYSDADTSGNDLATAKGDAVRKYDSFQYTNVTAASEAVVYLGNLRLPATTGYGDTSATEFTASKALKIITKTAGPSFTEDHVNTYFSWYTNGTRDLIIQFISTTQVQVSESGTIASEGKGIIQGFQNATLNHKGNNTIIKLMGNRLFVSRQIPLTGWSEIPILGTTRPSNALSSLYQDGDNAILINPSGQFRIVFSDASTPYFHKMNTDVPTVRITNVVYDSTKKFRYRILYTLSRLIGGKITYDRNDGQDHGIELIQETGPTEKNINRVDYGEVWTLKDQPIGDGSKTSGKLTGDTLVAPYDTVEGYKAIADAQMGVTINITTSNCEFDFRADENMGDIASEMQRGIRKANVEFKDVEVEFDTDHIVIWAGEGNTIGVCTAGTAGTDIVENVQLDTTSATVTTPVTTTPLTVGTFTVPPNSDHLTHFSAYRPPDSSEDEDNEHAYAWVGDYPICKAFTGVADGAGTFTPTEGILEAEDDGCVLADESGNELTITAVDADANTATVTPITAYGSRSWGLGGGTVITAAQTGTTITIESGKTLTAADEGKPFFWADRLSSTIKSVTDGANAEAVQEAEHPSQGAQMDPVSRSVTLTVSDEDIRDGRFSAWPLEHRFNVPIPDGDVGSLIDGYMLVGIRGSERFNYCERHPKWLMGSYNEGLQFNEQLWDGLQSIRSTDGGATIRGAITTRFQGTSGGYDAGDSRVGETVFKLPDLTKRSESIGTIGDGGAQELENGDEILITSEPACRVYDGDAYGKNLALYAIQKSDLQKMKPTYICGYQRILGMVVWGKQEVTDATESTAV